MIVAKEGLLLHEISQKEKLKQEVAKESAMKEELQTAQGGGPKRHCQSLLPRTKPQSWGGSKAPIPLPSSTSLGSEDSARSAPEGHPASCELPCCRFYHHGHAGSRLHWKHLYQLELKARRRIKSQSQMERLSLAGALQGWGICRPHWGRAALK